MYSESNVPDVFRQAVQKAEAAVSPKVNILIVDDLPEKLLVYEMMLGDLNENLVMANSGEEALKLLLQHEFAVILLDVNMPGMDGFETASLIRKRKRSAHTPIIFLTAFNDEVRMSQGYATGAVDYLPTPVVPQVLQAKVKVFIELFRMRRQAAIQAEERARRITAEAADRHKDEFLGMLAHELRNPLGPILNAVHLLRSNQGNHVPQEKLLEIVGRQVMHMSRLIDDLLDATRLARGQILLRKERCDLTSIVYQITEDHRSLFDSSGLTLEIEVPDAPVWVDGDATRLAQVVGNLLHNAHKFTGRGGNVKVKLDCNEEDGTATVTIADTGIGIAAEILPRIFDVFSQGDQGLDRNRGGLGLGLALVKGLVELHKGTVTAISEGSGKGAIFTLRMPVELIPASSHKRLFGAEGDQENKHRVLIIEDNRDAAETLHMLLDNDGHDIRIAFSGLDGLKIAQQFIPDIVLCDVGLPGMDGYQVMRSIRRNEFLSHVYSIALTGYGRDADRMDAHEAGFDMHLTKPIDCNNLRQIIKLINPQKMKASAAG